MAKRKQPAPKKAEKPLIPLNERPGRCRKCAEASFRLKFVERALIRECNECGDEIKL